MVGNVDTRLRHDLDRVWVQPVGLDARRVGFDDVAQERAGPTLGHLTAARVPSAEEKYSELLL